MGLFAHNYGANFFFVLAIVIGFFHGWLKLKYRYGILTFAFDIPLALALLVTLASIPRGAPWFPQSPTGTAIKILVAVCVLYLIIPFGVPLIAGISAFRAWCFIPMIYLLGFHLTRSVRQVETYFWIIIILGTITAVYGLRQTPEEIRKMMELDPEFRAKMVGTFYANNQGQSKLRAFSTFVSAGAFGSAMAYSIIFALSRFTVPGNSILERIILGGASAVMGFALLSTASRTSLVMLALGLFATAYYRRSVIQLVIVPCLAGVAYWLATRDLSSANGERFGSLLDFDTLFGRVYIVLAPAWDSLQQFPLGGGLGRSGHGLPWLFFNLTTTFDWRPVDGDLGRLLVEMGVLGLGIYINLMASGTREAFRCMRDLRSTPLGVVGVPGGAMFAISIFMIPTGSPFLGIPGGALLWFFLGSLERLTEEYHKAAAKSPLAARFDPAFISFIEDRKQKGLYGAGQPVAASTPQPLVPAGAPSHQFGSPTKRFLFHRTPAQAEQRAARLARHRSGRRNADAG